MQKSLVSSFLALLVLLLGTTLPARADVAVEKALFAFYHKNFDEAYTDFATAAENNPRDCFALVMWLESSHRLNRIGDVVTTLEAGVAKAPQDAVLLSQLALAYMYQSSEKLSAVTAGQEAFDKALSIDPNCSVAHTGLGLYYFTADKSAKAKNQLNKAVEVDPNNLIARERLGEILLTNDDKPELAIDKFKPVVAALPTYPDGYFFLAMAQEKAKKNHEAEANYEKSIELDPFALTRSVYARVRVARLYMDNKQTQKAIDTLQALVDLRPDFKEAKQELADLKSGKLTGSKVEQPSSPWQLDTTSGR